MSLSVLVKSASGLPNVERFGESDPVCVIVLQGTSIAIYRKMRRLYVDVDAKDIAKHAYLYFVCIMSVHTLYTLYAFN